MALTWTQQSTPTGFNNVWKSIAWSPDLGLFCAVGAVNAAGTDSHRIMTSPDGITWTMRDSGVSAANTWASVCWAGGTIQKFVACKLSGTDRIAWSADGTNWTHVNVQANIWNDICYSEDLDLLVAVASSGVNRVITSPDALVWTNQTAATARSWASVAWASSLGLFIAGSSNGGSPGGVGGLMTSPNGSAWTSRDTPGGAAPTTGTNIATKGICWSEDLGLALAVLANRTSTNVPFITSPDGINWTGRDIPSPDQENLNNWRGAVWSADAGMFVAVGDSSINNDVQVTTSPDGVTWTNQDPAVAAVQPWQQITYSPDLELFAAIADNTDNDGLSVMTAPNAGTVSPGFGGVAGGTTVSITGDGSNGGFQRANASIRVWFGTAAILTSATLADCIFPQSGIGIEEGLSVNVSDSTHLTVITPAFNNETVYVVVTDSNPSNACPNVLFVGADAFTYNAPFITSISPTTGPDSGGTAITVTGENLFNSNNTGSPGDIYFGVLLATDIVVVNSTTITCIAPQYDSISSNPVDVTYNPPHLTISAGVLTFPPTVLSAEYTYTAAWIELDGEDLTTIPWIDLLPIDACTSPLLYFITYTLNYISTGVGAEAAAGVAGANPSCIPCLILALLWGAMGLRNDIDGANSLAAAFPLCDFPKLAKFWFPPFVPPSRIIRRLSTIGTPDDVGWWLSIVDKFNGAALIVQDAVPRNPRSFIELSAFATGSAGMLGGFPGPATVWENHMLYAKGEYTVGTDRPPIHIFDGQFDRQIVEVPETAAGVVPKAVMTMLTANGTIYVTTLDSGSNDTNWSGRVFSLDIETGQLNQIGDTFPAGHIPYALTFFMGKLWCGTMRQDPTNHGRLYSFKPNVDSTWTLERDLTTDSMGGCASLLEFRGLLYVGCMADTGAFAKVLVRGVDTTYTTSLTATGGTASENNGFLAMVVWEDDLYASYWNPDTPTAVSKIYKFDGSSWTTVFNASTAASRIPYVGFPQDEDTLLAIGGGLTYDAQLRSTTDGTTWSDRSVFLTQGSPNATGLPVFGVVVR